jgi:hypothetical protein
LPSSLKVSKESILKYWEHWLLWRMAGKRVEAFVLATGWKGALPKAMLEVFFEVDNFLDKMESQALEKELKKTRNR